MSRESNEPSGKHCCGLAPDLQTPAEMGQLLLSFPNDVPASAPPTLQDQHFSPLRITFAPLDFPNPGSGMRRRRSSNNRGSWVDRSKCLLPTCCLRQKAQPVPWVDRPWCEGTKKVILEQREIESATAFHHRCSPCGQGFKVPLPASFEVGERHAEAPVARPQGECWRCPSLGQGTASFYMFLSGFRWIPRGAKLAGRPVGGPPLGRDMEQGWKIG